MAGADSVTGLGILVAL